MSIIRVYEVYCPVHYHWLEGRATDDAMVDAGKITELPTGDDGGSYSSLGSPKSRNRVELSGDPGSFDLDSRVMAKLDNKGA